MSLDPYSGIYRNECSSDGLKFTKKLRGRLDEPPLFPSLFRQPERRVASSAGYNDGIGQSLRIAWTPLTVVADITIVGGVIALAILAEAANDGATCY